MKLSRTQRENRALVNLKRGALTTRQLWQANVRNATLTTLQDAGHVAALVGEGPNDALWTLTRAGENELELRFVQGRFSTI